MKTSQDNLGAASETVRILLNGAKVMSHLYATLVYCLSFPSAMGELLAMFSLLALDVFAETKAPCALVGFDYYTQLHLAVAVPAGAVPLPGFSQTRAVASLRRPVA